MPNLASLPESTGIATHLWRLGHFIRDKVNEAKTRGELVETSETFVRRKMKILEFGEDGNVRTESTNEFVEKLQWHWKHQHQFMETVIKPSPAFQECSRFIAVNFSHKPSNNTSNLEHFAETIAAESRQTLSDETLVEYVTRFNNDLNDAPANVHVFAWLDGLWLTEDRFQLPEFTLRRPNASDLENEQLLSIALHNVPIFPPFFSPVAILECTVKSAPQAFSQEELLRLTGALRLYRLGSVQAVSYTMRPDSFTRFGGTIGSPSIHHSIEKFPIRKEDLESLGKFVSIIKPLLPAPFSGNDGLPETADLGFVRYSDAMLKGGDVQGRVTAAITCLEALFLKGKERSELAHKLSLRVASLLRLLKLNPIEVQSHVHQAYEIRSTYIHGGQSDKEQLAAAQKLYKKVLDYARVSTVIFLQLKGRVDKDEFLGKLDRALLEPKSLERVQKQLDELTVPWGNDDSNG